MDLMWISVVAAILGGLVVVYFIRYILKQDEGTEQIKEISGAIKEGAFAFIHREYRTLAVVVIVVAIILGLLGLVSPDLGWKAALAFIFGAICSMAAGYIGMNIAVRSNGRTTTAVQKNLNRGLRVAFRAGAVMGLTVVSIGLLGLAIVYYVWHNDPHFIAIIPAYGTGASLVALFARLGGGIFTKGADAGSDLVGKVEAGIPEDDPRNAAVIADFVGDNVGDVCGVGADLFESYVETIIAAMSLGTLAVALGIVLNTQTSWFLPMLIRASGIIASIVGCFVVRVGEEASVSSLSGALRRGTLVAAILAAIFSVPIVYFLQADWGVLWSILLGLIVGVVIGEATNYYTSYDFKPTKQIAEAATFGGGATIIRGFAVGLMSCWPAVIAVAIATVFAYKFAGFYGVVMASIGMLSTLGVTLAADSYGPVSDNAGGIATMVGLPPEIRDKTDALDSVGNTTKATAKGFAIGSAALDVLGLTLAFGIAAGLVTVSGGNIVAAPELNLLSVPVIVGILLGALLPAIFVAMIMNSVGVTTGLIVEEVRRQWREIPGLREGKAKAQYGRCVDICTRAALREMIAPSIMSIVAPVIVGLVLGRFALGGFLIGALATGFVLAVALNNAGGAWDNAKKYVEAGNFGGKGSEAHKAAVIGDTTGDPMKDAAGPSLNIQIKLMAVVSLLLAPVLANFPGLL
ncbi:MAG: sodium-translocating pyrophosphatase [Chloroflexota bacterium]